MRLLGLTLTNFLSYRSAYVSFEDLTALVGPNASGKSNVVAALKLLGEIPKYGLQTALARRGGFDQLRHRVAGRGKPLDPSIAIDFEVASGFEPSRYELRLGSLAGKRYTVKQEAGHVNSDNGYFAFTRWGKRLSFSGSWEGTHQGIPRVPEDFEAPEGQSVLPFIGIFGELDLIWHFLQTIQIVEINPARVRDFQEPSSTGDLEPDGSNSASVLEQLPRERRRELVDELAAIVPGLADIQPRHYSTKLTIVFTQQTGEKRREFVANQISDGTLRAFGILLALHQPIRKNVIVIEEPEAAIHLGALRTQVDILNQHADEHQIVMTTHSADIIDALRENQIRVVWTEDGASHVAPLAPHTRETLRTGLITPGELLRANALDPVGG
ncbi:MAG: AAA family ATPase [Actinomycetota bacterium]